MPFFLSDSFNYPNKTANIMKLYIIGRMDASYGMECIPRVDHQPINCSSNEQNYFGSGFMSTVNKQSHFGLEIEVNQIETNVCVVILSIKLMGNMSYSLTQSTIRHRTLSIIGTWPVPFTLYPLALLSIRLRTFALHILCHVLQIIKLFYGFRHDERMINNKRYFNVSIFHLIY